MTSLSLYYLVGTLVHGAITIRHDWRVGEKYDDVRVLVARYVVFLVGVPLWPLTIVCEIHDFLKGENHE